MKSQLIGGLHCERPNANSSKFQHLSCGNRPFVQSLNIYSSASWQKKSSSHANRFVSCHQTDRHCSQLSKLQQPFTQKSSGRDYSTMQQHIHKQKPNRKARTQNVCTVAHVSRRKDPTHHRKSPEIFTKTATRT